jgi:hypothetical protein
VDTSRGLAAGDVDDDGDDDLLVIEGSGSVRLYRNACGDGKRWVGLRLVDPRTGGDALGASARLGVGDRTLRRDVSIARSYLSSGDARLRFALGDATPGELVVRWTDGLVERHDPPPAGRYTTIERGTGSPVEPPPPEESR